MAKFNGVMGYAIQIESRPGVWTNQVIERDCKGDVLQNMNRWQQQSESVNDNYKIDNKLSIIADLFIYEHMAFLKYIRWMGVNWKVDRIEVVRPRLIITLGGVYNGQTA